MEIRVVCLYAAAGVLEVIDLFSNSRKTRKIRDLGLRCFHRQEDLKA